MVDHGFLMDWEMPPWIPSIKSMPFTNGIGKRKKRGGRSHKKTEKGFRLSSVFREIFDLFCTKRFNDSTTWPTLQYAHYKYIKWRFKIRIA
jgi:hypothetical protein